MSASVFVAGDWGTSHLRLLLCRDTEMLEQRDGPGIAALAGNHAEVISERVVDELLREVMDLITSAQKKAKVNRLEPPARRAQLR